MVLRLVLDVNVWVNHYLSLSRGREGSAAQQLVNIAFNGHCRLGPVQPIISHAMLDTLQEVLVGINLPERFAEAARNAVEASATGGMVGEAPVAVLGGGVQPLLDLEDQAVLDTAVAAGSDLLVTNNMEDFTPGPRAGIHADVMRRNPEGQPDTLLFKHPRLRHGLIIASVFAARSWLYHGEPPPPGVLGQFLPREIQSTNQRARRSGR